MVGIEASKEETSPKDLIFVYLNGVFLMYEYFMSEKKKTSSGIIMEKSAQWIKSAKIQSPQDETW